MIERKEARLSMAYLPKNLRALRVKNELLVEQIALLIGVTTTSIRSYEAGTTVPNVAKLVTLANLFDVSLEYFFMDENQKSASDHQTC